MKYRNASERKDLEPFYETRCVAKLAQNKLACIRDWDYLGFFIPAYVVSVYYLVFYTYLKPGLNCLGD